MYGMVSTLINNSSPLEGVPVATSLNIDLFGRRHCLSHEPQGGCHLLCYASYHKLNVMFEKIAFKFNNFCAV